MKGRTRVPVRVTEPQRWIVTGLFAAVLVMTVLQEAADDAFHVWSLCLLYVGFAVSAVATVDRDADLRGLAIILLQGLFGLALAWIVIRQKEGGIPASGRGLHVGLVFAAIAGFTLLATRTRAYLRANAVYLLGFLLVLGGYLYHVPGLAAGSGLAAFPVFSGVVFALGLLVAPRYVSRDDFLWLVAGLTGVLVVLGLAVYAVGAYGLGPMTVRLWDSPVVLVAVPTGVPAMRSVFANPNTLGLLSFAGAVGALVLLVDALTADPGHSLGSRSPGASPARRVLRTAVAGVLLALGVTGVVLSGSRASVLAMTASAVVYLGAVFLGTTGRRTAFGLVMAGIVAGLWAIAAGHVPIDTNYRLSLWRGSVEAVARSPSVLGYGMVSGADVIEPYLSEGTPGYSPHNSYLSTLIHVGLVGGVGYLLLTVGNVVDGAVGYPPDRQVDHGVLGLATGFAVHQLFESYSLFGFEVGSVLGTLAAGYLLASRVEFDLPAPPTTTTFRWALLSRPPEPAPPPDWPRLR